MTNVIQTDMMRLCFTMVFPSAPQPSADPSVVSRGPVSTGVKGRRVGGAGVTSVTPASVLQIAPVGSC